MRIATWNVERLKHHKETSGIIRAIEEVDADILVLTETDTRLSPAYPYYYHTPLLYDIRPDYYKGTENRIAVFSKYKCVRQYETYDKYTALCVELKTEFGNILVYGTIMGILGNRESSFKADLAKQMEDVRRFASQGHSLCVIGDYNLSFCDNYYFTRYGRDLVNHAFRECDIEILTKSKPWCIDHIATSRRFSHTASAIVEWNLDKRFSDHKGIAVDIEYGSFIR